jgi:hypothetical protein
MIESQYFFIDKKIVNIIDCYTLGWYDFICENILI